MSQEQPFLQQIRNTANVTLDVIIAGMQANINAAYQQANSAANTVLVSYNDTTILANAFLNFNSSPSINVSISANGIYETNVSFTTNVAAIQGIVAPAYNAANAAFIQATDAYNQANNAYTTANVGVSVSGVTAGSYGSGAAIVRITVDARGRVTGVTTTPYQTFSSTNSGIVPASGGGGTNVLYANGVWAAAQVTTAQTLSANGSAAFAGGLTLIWGQVSADYSGETGPIAITFHQAFPTACLFASVVPDGGVPPMGVTNLTATGCYVYTGYTGGSTSQTKVTYFAIGH